MGGHGQSLGPPVVVEAEQGPDAEAAHAGLGAPVGGGQAPVVVALLAQPVDGGVGRAVVGLLVDHEPVGAGGHEIPVGGGVPHLHLERHLRNDRGQGGDAVPQIALRHDAGVLPGHEQHVPEPRLDKGRALGGDLAGREGAAGDVIAGREPAVGADADALVGQVQRREQVHGPPEAPQRRGPGQCRHVLEPVAGGVGQQRGEVPEVAPGPPQRPVDVARCGRGGERPQPGDIGGHDIGRRRPVRDPVRPGRQGDGRGRHGVAASNWRSSARIWRRRNAGWAGWPSLIGRAP